MPTSQQGKKEQDPLKKQFQILEQDWNSYKESIPRRRRRRCRLSRSLSPVDNNHGEEFLGLGLFDNSPRKLLSCLQQCHSPLRRQRSNILEGRNLLEALESAKDVDAASACSSACSSVLIQEEGSCLSSCSCSCFSFDADSDSNSSSPASLCREEGTGRSGEERWLVRMTLLGIAIWMVALGIILAMAGFGGEEEHGEYITPT